VILNCFELCEDFSIGNALMNFPLLLMPNQDSSGLSFMLSSDTINMLFSNS
jgi:hypothetical protein